jgi:hypothetical protein
MARGLRPLAGDGVLQQRLADPGYKPATTSLLTAWPI